MIGVLVSPAERESVEEFFELFKTPWEYLRPGSAYDVVLSTTEEISTVDAPLVVRFAPVTPVQFVDNCGGSASPGAYVVVSGDGLRFPIYGAPDVTGDRRQGVLILESTGDPVAAVAIEAESTVVRVGYNLFEQVRCLLTFGQPETFADIPTLDIHIDCLRSWIVRSGRSLPEIPPVPAGYSFTACLTHDVDHPRQRLHRFDHTMGGFLFRATAGTAIDFLRRRRSFAELRRNFRAAALLPLVHSGIVADPWSRFDQYLDIDGPGASTFFVLPGKDDPGRAGPGTSAPPHRASPYGAAEIANRIGHLSASGAEVATHGIDAWLESASGISERAAVTAAGGNSRGVRMHWLYFDKGSPARLAAAGFCYDSTFGYCSTVGYRPGTTQPFKPPGAAGLWELPLHIMDTALFYPAYLNLSFAAAADRIRPMIRHAASAGGVLTINWHDRSLFPERQWGEFYRNLVSDLKASDAWTPTASTAIRWFERRRNATLHSECTPDASLHVEVQSEPDPSTPPLRLRVHHPVPGGFRNSAAGPVRYTDFEVQDRFATSIPA